MPRQIEVDGVGIFEFPDEATDADIGSALQRELGGSAPNRGILGETGARVAIGFLSPLKGAADFGAAAQRFYGPLAKLSPIGWGDFGKSSEVIESAMPEPGVRQGFGYDVAEGLGQFVSMALGGLGAGMLARGAAAGAAAMGTAAGLGFGMEFSDAYNRELERQQRIGEQPNPDLAFAKALGYGAVSSLIEGKFGSGRIAKRIGEALAGKTGAEFVSRGVSPDLVRRVAGNALREAGIGFGQEASQRLLQDIIVEGQPDPAAIGYEGLVGGAVQGLTGIPIGAVEATTARRNARQEAALREYNTLQQEAQDRRNQFAFAQANEARLSAQPEPYVPSEAEIPGFNVRIVPANVTPIPPPSSQIIAQRAAERLGALEGTTQTQRGPGARINLGIEDILTLPPEVVEQLWRYRQETPDASALRTSSGQLPQAGPAIEGGQTPGSNVVERQPQREEPVAQGAQVAKPTIGGEVNAEVQGKEEEVAQAPTGVPQKPAGSITPRSAKVVDIEDVDAVAAESERQAQARATAAVPPVPQIKIGPKGATVVLPGDEVETVQTYRQSRRTKLGKRSEAVGKVRGRVIRQTPSGGIEVEFTSEDEPKGFTKKYTGTRQVVEPKALTKTGKSLGPSTKTGEKLVATPSMIERFASPNRPITDAERKQLFDLGYDYNDFWQMKPPEVRSIISKGERGPGKREMLIGKKSAEQVAQAPAQTSWKANREYFPGALLTMQRVLNALRVVVSKRNITPEAIQSDPLGASSLKTYGITNDDLENADIGLEKLSYLLGLGKDNKEAAFVFARRYWDNAQDIVERSKKISLSDEEQHRLLLTLLSGQPTPLQSEIDAARANPYASILTRNLEEANPYEAKGYAPWVSATPAITSGASPALQYGSVTQQIEADYSAAIASGNSESAQETVRAAAGVPNVFDAKNGIGSVPFNQDVGYRGFRMFLKPSEFRALVPPGVSGDKTAQSVEKALREGKKIGQPFLDATWDENSRTWNVYDHEGRSRSDAFANVFGDVPMEVHVFPRKGLRARDITNEMRQAGWVGQNGKGAISVTPQMVGDAIVKDATGNIIPLSQRFGQQQPQLRIGEATRDIVGRLGGEIVEAPDLDRALAARIDEAGNIQIGVNAAILSRTDPDAQNAAGTEELIHASVFRIMFREWVAKGRKGTFKDYIEREAASIWRALSPEVQQQVVSEYSGDVAVKQSDGQWGLEYLRRIVQKGRFVMLTEQYVRGAKPKIESIFRKVWNYLKEIIVGSPHSQRAMELVNAVEAVLDGLAIGSIGAESARVTPSSVAAEAGVSPALRSLADLQNVVSKGGSDVPPELLQRQLEAERSMFDPQFIKNIEDRYAKATLPKDNYTVPPTGWTLRKENIVARLLKPIVEKINIVKGVRDPKSLAESERGAAYYGIVRTHEWLLGMRNNWVNYIKRAADKKEKMAPLQEGATHAKAVASIQATAATKLVDGYKAYLEQIRTALPPQHPLNGQLSQLIGQTAAATNQEGTNGVFDNGNVEGALKWIAAQPSIIVDPNSTPESIVDQAAKLGGDRGVGENVDNKQAKIDALYTGVKDASGKYVVTPALYNIPNLPDIISTIRAYTVHLNHIVETTNSFKKLLGLKPGSGRPFAVRRFLVTYNKLRQEAKENADAAAAFDTAWQKNDATLQAYTDALVLLDSLMTNPEYFNRVVEALQQTNTYRDTIHYPAGNLGTKVIRDPITNADVQITQSFTAEEEQANRDKIIPLIENIDKYLEAKASAGGAPNPMEVFSYQRLKDQLLAMWIDSDFAPEWNIINPRGPGALWPKFTPGLTKRYMAEFIGGRSGRAINTAITHLDVLLGKVYNIQQDENIGIKAAQRAHSDAMKSHEMNPNDPRDVLIYQRQILNWIIYYGQYASQNTYKAGEHLPSGYVATKEDIEAARKTVAYKNAIRGVSEKDAIRNNMHSSIAEELGVERTIAGKQTVGKTSIHRNTVTEGPLETSGRKQVGARRDFVTQFVNAKSLDEKARLVDPDENWENFHDVIIGYLGVTDPLFNRVQRDDDGVWHRNSRYEDKIRKLGAKLRSGEVQLTSWDDIASALGEDVNEVKKNLLIEASGWLEKYKSNEIDSAAARGDSDPMTAILNSLHNDGSFLHPRLKSNAPPTFYTYGDVTEADLTAYAANAANIARARVLEEMQRAYISLSQYVAALKAKRPGDLRATELESREAVKAGKARFSMGDAEHIAGQLRQLSSWFGEYAQKHAEAFDHGINQFIRATNSFYAGTLLQSPMAILNNGIDALYSNPLLMNTYLNSWKNVIASPLTTSRQIANVAMGRIMSASKKYPALRAWAKKNKGFVASALNAIAEDWEMWNKLKRDLNAYGINNGLDWVNQRALRRQAWGNTFFSLDAWKRALAERDPGAVLPGIGSLESPGSESSFLLKLGRTVYNSWLPAYMMRYVPRKVDQLANVMIAMQWMKATGKLMERSITLSKNRVDEFGKLDHTNPKQRITPEQMDMTPAQLNVLRKSLDSIGGLERVMFDYYKRYEDAKSKGEDVSAVPWLKDGEIDNWLMTVMEYGNVVREANTIDVAKAYGTPGTLFFTFLSWPANRILNVARTFNSMNYAKGGMPVAAAVIALLITAVAAKELKRPIVEAVTGKVSSMPTLGNVMNEANPVEVARYFGSALGSMIPLIGNTVEVVTGGASGRPLFDATASIPALGLIADTFDTAKKHVDSGDSRVWLDWVNRHGPLYALSVNRIPGVDADLAARNAARAVRAATPADMEVRALYGGRGGMSRITPFTRHLRSAEAAAYSGDESRFRESVQAAKEFQMAKGQDEKSAEQAVVSYLRSRMPMSRVYGRAVSPAEYERVTGRMSGAQRRAFEPSARAYALAERVTGRKLRAYREARPKKSKSSLRFRLPSINTRLPKMRKMRSVVV